VQAGRLNEEPVEADDVEPGGASDGSALDGLGFGQVTGVIDQRKRSDFDSGVAGGGDGFTRPGPFISAQTVVSWARGSGLLPGFVANREFHGSFLTHVFREASEVMNRLLS
jgi:hypothetical protein